MNLSIQHTKANNSSMIKLELTPIIRTPGVRFQEEESQPYIPQLRFFRLYNYPEPLATSIYFSNIQIEPRIRKTFMVLAHFFPTLFITHACKINHPHTHEVSPQYPIIAMFEIKSWGDEVLPFWMKNLALYLNIFKPLNDNRRSI